MEEKMTSADNVSNRKYVYYDNEKDKEHILHEFKKPLEKKYEMDKILEKIIRPHIENKKLKVLDACCGIGQISHYLYEMNKNLHITGIDQTKFLIDEAKRLWKNDEIVF